MLSQCFPAVKQDPFVCFIIYLVRFFNLSSEANKSSLQLLEPLVETSRFLLVGAGSVKLVVVVFQRSERSDWLEIWNAALR